MLGGSRGEREDGVQNQELRLSHFSTAYDRNAFSQAWGGVAGRITNASIRNVAVVGNEAQLGSDTHWIDVGPHRKAVRCSEEIGESRLVLGCCFRFPCRTITYASDEHISDGTPGC